VILKILALAIVIAIVYFLFFKSNRKSDSNNKNIETPDEVMLECSKCGTYTTGAESILKDGKYYCSKECAGVK
jgi:uncharacterized protein